MKQQARFAAMGMAFLLAGMPANAQDEKKTANYYPMQVGNQWTYQVQAGGNTGTAFSRIVKTETINEVPLAYLEATIKGKVIGTEHLRQTEKGIFRYRNNGQEIKPPICLLQYPSKPGAKWKGDITVGKDEGKYFAEVMEETVEVKAGKFKAMRVNIKLESPREGTVKTSYWFVPDIGFVRQSFDTGRLSVVMELEKFQPAKKAE